MRELRLAEAILALLAPRDRAATAVLGWFAYMLMRLLLTMAFAIAATVVWGLLYVAANHTGLELVVNALSLEQPEGFAPPGQLVACLQLVLAIAAPLVIFLGQWSPPRLPALQIATGTTASALALTLIVLCVLSGAVRERQLSNAASSPAS